MSERLAESINSIVYKFDSPVAQEFINKLSEGQLTRDENPHTHLCVYFAGIDPVSKQIFFGHHKKSGLWLFNGGHIDRGEVPLQTLKREMGEEWGDEVKVDVDELFGPELITITEINNPTKQTCTKHYDIWYFVPLPTTTKFDKAKLDKEFHEARWMTPSFALTITKDPNTIKAINYIQDKFNLLK